MRLRDLSVRQRLLGNNFIMMLVPILLLVIFASIFFHGLRATGNFRERELEILWPEAGSSIPVQTGLSHIYMNVDGGEHESLARHVSSMEAMGIKVAVIRDGKIDYETEPGSAQQLIAESYHEAPDGDNVMRWDDNGLVYRYISKDRASIGVAVGNVPFNIHAGFFPPHMSETWRLLAMIVFLLAALVIVCAGLLLVRKMTKDIVRPLEELQRSSRRIQHGDYDTPVPCHGTDELGETAVIFDEMRRQLKEDRQLRDRYDRNRQELLAGIAHDLATPLTKIQGYTSGILDGIANTPEKQRRYLELVHKTSRQMEQMVRELFLFSKLELGKVDFQWERVYLPDVLNEYVRLQCQPLQDQGFVLCFKNQLGRSAAMVRLDRMQFRRVLDNILSNAIKYKAGDHGELTFSLSEQDQGLLLACEDRGKGVAEKELPHLFEAFYRTDKARSEVAKGSGLGLAVTAGIIQAMGGKIWAEAARPQGLCIKIWLPETGKGSGQK